MTCGEARGLLDAYADAELELMHSLELERHLEQCGECVRAREDIIATREAVRGAAPYYTAPLVLCERVRALSGPARTSSRLKRWMPRAIEWPWLITAAAVLAAVIVIVRGFTPPTTPSPRLVASEAVASHVRSLMANHLADVVSSNQHTVK
ncbi:MAG: anti-sigma factor family protein, partial [Candidatus Binataceae bacterium]